MAKILMVGWHPDVVDYAKWPGLSAERLRAGIQADDAALRSLGHEVTVQFIRDARRAPAELEAALEAQDYAVVLIGAGVRRDEAHFQLFERLVNSVHAHAPGAKIAFNSGPTDTAAAVKRWL